MTIHLDTLLDATLNPNGFPEMRRRTPGRAIRAYCAYCIGDGTPRECRVADCPLHPFRTGRNPYLPKGKGNPEALAAANMARRAQKSAQDAPPGTRRGTDSPQAQPGRAQTSILRQQNGPTRPLRREGALAGTPAGAQAQRRGRP